MHLDKKLKWKEEVSELYREGKKLRLWVDYGVTMKVKLLLVIDNEAVLFLKGQ